MKKKRFFQYMPDIYTNIKKKLKKHRFQGFLFLEERNAPMENKSIFQ